jgi:hypothetical protein
VGFFAPPHLASPAGGEIERLAERPLRSAEICLLVGQSASALGFRRPSYEQVRLHVCRSRRRP